MFEHRDRMKPVVSNTAMRPSSVRKLRSLNWGRHLRTRVLERRESLRIPKMNEGPPRRALIEIRLILQSRSYARRQSTQRGLILTLARSRTLADPEVLALVERILPPFPRITGPPLAFAVKQLLIVASRSARGSIAVAGFRPTLGCGVRQFPFPVPNAKRIICSY